MVDLLDGSRYSTYVKVLLVGLIIAIGVSDRCKKVVLLVDHIVTDTTAVGELHISVYVDLDDTEGDGVKVLLLGGTGATVEDEEDGFVFFGLKGGLDVLLVLSEKLRVQLDIARLVYTMDVAETSSNGEVGGDGSEGLLDVENILGLSVQRSVVNIFVVDTIFLTTSDTNLHLEPLLHGSGTLKVLGSCLDVPLNRLLGKVDHVRGEKGLAGGLEVGLIGIEHTVEPGEELLGAVVGMKNDRDTVGGGDGTDVVSAGNRTSNGGGLVAVAYTLLSSVFSKTLYGARWPCAKLTLPAK